MSGLDVFGPVMQIAFVVDDLDATLAHWTTKMGVGWRDPSAVGVHAERHALRLREQRFSPGGMIELIETVPAITDYFELIKDAAARWDGSNPIIRV